MSLVKYRLKEVATDFGVAPKVIADIISKYFQKPKSNTQVLTDEELNLVFDHMTQTHQIASLEQVFAVKPAPKAEPPKPEAPATLHVMEELSADPATTLYVGDSNVDVLTGHNAGLKSAGVTWGFRGRAELEAAGADYVVDTQEELAALVLGE